MLVWLAGVQRLSVQRTPSFISRTIQVLASCRDCLQSTFTSVFWLLRQREEKVSGWANLRHMPTLEPIPVWAQALTKTSGQLGPRIMKSFVLRPPITVLFYRSKLSRCSNPTDSLSSVVPLVIPWLHFRQGPFPLRASFTVPRCAHWSLLLKAARMRVCMEKNQVKTLPAWGGGAG